MCALLFGASWAPGLYTRTQPRLDCINLRLTDRHAKSGAACRVDESAADLHCVGLFGLRGVADAGLRHTRCAEGEQGERDTAKENRPPKGRAQGRKQDVQKAWRDER